MIEIAPAKAGRSLPWANWFPAGAPGPPALAEHALATGHGRWWADRPKHPRAVAVRCAEYAMLRGSPEALTAADLAPLAHTYLDVPPHFQPLLTAAFDRIALYERTIWICADPPRSPRPVPDGITLRRLTAADAVVVADLGSRLAWISDSWGGPRMLAASGHAWGAFAGRRLLSLAVSYVRGERYEDIAAVTLPEHRRRGLATSCVTALCGDVRDRGRAASWTCSGDLRMTMVPAWTTGFRLVRDYAHFAVGAAVGADRSGAARAHSS
ncbi:GNAT family N-acetyltransferase [Streptomyces sp. NPDC004134]|uniref:GNAT family N-acetyltransferase n=1 Tax=Streptomyces sp. NPDC004134 TaxID=3364691 RepID=UPI0036A73776